MSLSIEHEAPIELCREHPSVVLSLLTKVLHLPIPLFSSLRITDPNSRQTQVTGYRSDCAFLFEQSDRPVVAVVIEPQRSIDDRKRRSWPKYLADLHAEVGCDSYLVVLAFTRAVAAWARDPITSYQPGVGFVPYVIGPDDVPRVVSVDQAREDPWLAALSALMHANEEQGEQDALHTLQAAKETAGPEQAWWLYQLIRAIMTPERCTLLQELIMLNPEVYLPKTKYERQQWAAGEAAGKAEGKTEALLFVLSERGLSMNEEQRQRILSCRDLSLLDTWFKRALRAATIEELLA